MTVYGWPPIVSVPVRLDADGFALTVNEIVDGPVPLALPASTVIQLSLLVAFQTQPVSVFNPTLPGPPAAAIDCPDDAKE